MKKRIIFIFSGVIILLLFGIFLTGMQYKKNVDLYTLSDSDSKLTNIVIDNQTYTFNHSRGWTAVNLDKRIGYISEHQNNNFLLFYSFFEHGIYTLQEDPEHNFLQIRKWFADKQYTLLVKDDYEFPSPDKVNFDYFTLSYYDNDNKITDQDLIRSLFFQYVNASNDQIFTYEQMASWDIGFQLKFYTSEYPSLCFYMTIYYSNENKDFYLQGENNRYIKLSNDCSAHFARYL